MVPRCSGVRKDGRGSRHLTMARGTTQPVDDEGPAAEPPPEAIRQLDRTVTYVPGGCLPRRCYGRKPDGRWRGELVSDSRRMQTLMGHRGQRFSHRPSEEEFACFARHRPPHSAVPLTIEFFLVKEDFATSAARSDCAIWKSRPLNEDLLPVRLIYDCTLAIAMISTRTPGLASATPAVARGGGLSGSTQASHATFIPAKSAISLSQI